MVENINANSPRVKLKPRTRQGRRVARRGGVARAASRVWPHGTMMDLYFGARWSGGVRELRIYSPVVL
jgi:hypothetical protein